MFQLSQIELQFDTNIAEDKSSINVSYEELKGCDEHFIQNLKTFIDKNSNQTRYVLGCDYPTYAGTFHFNYLFLFNCHYFFPPPFGPFIYFDS